MMLICDSGENYSTPNLINALEFIWKASKEVIRPSLLEPQYALYRLSHLTLASSLGGSSSCKARKEVLWECLDVFGSQ